MRDDQRRAARTGRRRAPGERGSALVLAVLILFAMLALGMIAMRTTTQNIAGSGNLRVNKQARYLAEIGLYHAVTIMQQRGADLLALLGGRRGSIEVNSAGQVIARDQDDNVVGQANIPGPDVLTQGPAPLGLASSNGMQLSYTVSVEGFSPGPVAPGYDPLDIRNNGEVFCLMQFTARSFVAPQALPTQVQLDPAGADARRAAADTFAEHSLKAAVVLGPFQTAFCVQP